MLWTLIFVVVFLVLWGFAWRSQTKLAFGIFIGLFIGMALGASLGPYESAADIPMWLPPLPFATVVVMLFIYGFLAWWLLDVKGGSAEGNRPDT
jgi:hypothetical protein